MRYLVIFVVRLYWAIIPASARRHCLFRESCSHYVFRAAKERGFRAAIKALRTRLKQCRPGYAPYTAPDGKEYCVLADGTMVPGCELREGIC